MSWWAHFFGLDNASGPPYLAWSGVVSDLPEVVGALAAISAFALLVIHLNCHEPGCRRVGRYPVAGGQWRVCRRHHPDGPPAPGQIARDHHAHLGAHRDRTNS